MFLFLLVVVNHPDNKLLIFDDQISQNARRIGLDVQMDNLTIGDGNCWYRAVVQQIHRTEVFQMLEPCKIYDSHYHLRLDVVAFVREQVHVSQAVHNYKQFYEETLRFEYDNELNMTMTTCLGRNFLVTKKATEYIVPKYSH